jgi:hypothetical protein
MELACLLDDLVNGESADYSAAECTDSGGLRKCLESVMAMPPLRSAKRGGRGGSDLPVAA